jgi:hypothetical protein
MTEQIYDRHTGSYVEWTPLDHQQRRIVGPGLGDQALVEITGMGTCGNPNDPDYSSHRIETMIPILQGTHSIDTDKYFWNPEKETWYPIDAPVEGVHFGRAAINTTWVSNRTKGAAGIMEMGASGLGAFLRGQHAIVGMELNEKSPEETLVARKLAKMVMEATVAAYPAFTIVNSVEEMTHIAAVRLKDEIQNRKHNIHKTTEIIEPRSRSDLERQVFISGSSGKTMPYYMKEAQSRLEGLGIPTKNSFSKTWGDYEMGKELLDKLNSCVQIIAITPDTESLGALGELMPRITYGVLSGQSVVIAITMHESSENNSDSNRTRILALEHLNRLLQDFPGLPVYLAKNLDELITVGASEYYKQLQRLETNKRRMSEISTEPKVAQE